MFAGIFVNAIIITLLGPSIIKIMNELSIDFSFAGAILSFWSLGVMTSILTGKLADRYGPFNVVRVGFLAMGISSALIGLSNNILFFFRRWNCYRLC
ncbi:MAG: MFS transporter [Thermoproteota archaeon]